MEELKQTQIDYGKVLTWYFNDPRFWPTILTLSLYMLSCVFIVPIFYVVPLLTGYSISLIRNIQKGKYEIPEIDSSYWTDGAKLLLAYIGVTVIFMVIFMILGFGGMLLSGMLGRNGDSNGLGVITLLVTNVFSIVFQLVYSIVLPFILLLAYAIYAKTNSLSSVFAWSNYVAMWRNSRWNLVIGYFVYYAGVMALSMVGFMACCVGILPAMAASTFIMAGLVGQLGTEGVRD